VCRASSAAPMPGATAWCSHVGVVVTRCMRVVCRSAVATCDQIYYFRNFRNFVKEFSRCFLCLCGVFQVRMPPSHILRGKTVNLSTLLGLAMREGGWKEFDTTRDVQRVPQRPRTTHSSVDARFLLLLNTLWRRHNKKHARSSPSSLLSGEGSGTGTKTDVLSDFHHHLSASHSHQPDQSSQESVRSVRSTTVSESYSLMSTVLSAVSISTAGAWVADARV
jgi:hypothetical protein